MDFFHRTPESVEAKAHRREQSRLTQEASAIQMTQKSNRDFLYVMWKGEMRMLGM